MPYLRNIKIEDDNSRKYIQEFKESPQPCKEVKLHGQFFVKQENMDATVAESSNSTADVKIKLEDDFPKKPKLEPQFEPFPSRPVVVGCTACYRYSMAYNVVCLFCRRRAHTVEELSRE